MVRSILAKVLPVVLALLMSGAAFAQTEYVIPDGTGIDYIYYGVTPPYTNTFFDIPATINGVSYTVSGYLHFTAGNPAATNGSITFTQYTPTGSTSYTETLTNINYSPFSLAAATATANFAGQFNGSLTFNIQEHCRGRYCSDYLTTVNGVHSNFTID